MISKAASRRPRDGWESADWCPDESVGDSHMQIELNDDHWCFACGAENPHGLKLDDIHLENDECVCTFAPARCHQGWAQMMHGGITATLLDEVMTHLLWRRGYDAMTAELTIRLKAPIPLGETLTVRSRLTGRRGKLAETEAEVYLQDGTTAATGSSKHLVSQRAPDQPGGRISLSARQAVIFDLFGTLVPVFKQDEYYETLRAVARELGIDADDFITAFRADAQERTIGKWPTLEGNVADIARRLGLNPSDEQVARATQLRTDFTRRHLMNPFPDSLPVLRALRDAGRPVGLISDCSPEAPMIWPESPLAEVALQPVFSADVGVRKPDARIYGIACERMGVDPWRTVYVGDGDSQELPGAREVGLCPILIDRGEPGAFRPDGSNEADVIVRDLTQVLPLIGLDT